MELVFQFKTGTILDIGANIGQTLLNIRGMGNTSKYIAFEPNPYLASYLSKLVDANKMDKVKVIGAGLSGETTISEFRYSSISSSGASTKPEMRAGNFHDRSMQVPVYSGDDLIPAFELYDLCLVKIDVEGGELEVLMGLSATIEQNRPAVICEVLPVYDESTEVGALRRERTNKFMRFFQDMDYSVARIHESGRLEWIDHIETHGDLDLVNYLAVPNELEKRICR